MTQTAGTNFRQFYRFSRVQSAEFCNQKNKGFFNTKRSLQFGSEPGSQEGKGQGSPQPTTTTIPRTIIRSFIMVNFIRFTSPILYMCQFCTTVQDRHVRISHKVQEDEERGDLRTQKNGPPEETRPYAAAWQRRGRRVSNISRRGTKSCSSSVKILLNVLRKTRVSQGSRIDAIALHQSALTPTTASIRSLNDKGSKKRTIFNIFQH